MFSQTLVRQFRSFSISSGRRLTGVSHNLAASEQHSPDSPKNAIFACQNLQDLGRLVSNRSTVLNLENITAILQRGTSLASNGSANPEAMKDFGKSSLDKLLQVTHNNMHQMDFDRLYSIISFCLKMKLPDGSEMWNSIERHSRFVAPKTDINQLIQVNQVHKTK